MIERFNSGIKDTISGRLEQDILNEVLVIKEEINEIVRACQMAKNGLVNTNLLDIEEINRIVNEVETLPYANEIEAIEYTPSVYTNNSVLLYILSIPKVRNEEYNLLITTASIVATKQVELKYERVLVNQRSTYGLRDKCLTINNSTVCADSALDKLADNDCINRLIKGGPTSCFFRTNTEEVIELIKEDTIYLTNFKGELISGNITKPLVGTYIIHISNETVQIKDRTFSSRRPTSLQALPTVLSNITEKDRRIDIGFVHSISMHNIKILSDLSWKLRTSTAVTTSVLLLVVIVICTILWKIYGRINIPAPAGIDSSNNGQQIAAPQSGLRQNYLPGTDVTADLRDVDL